MGNNGFKAINFKTQWNVMELNLTGMPRKKMFHIDANFFLETKEVDFYSLLKILQVMPQTVTRNW